MVQCVECLQNKLRHEFHSLRFFSEACSHPAPLICLRCLPQKLELASDEPQPCPECQEDVPVATLRILLAQAAALYSVALPSPSVQHADSGLQATFQVSLLAGETVNIAFDPQMTVAELKKNLEELTKVPTAKQRLTFGGLELQSFREGKQMQLKDFNVIHGSCVQLMVLMHDLMGEMALGSVRLELSWGYPPAGKDFLDGLCLAFDIAGNHLVTADYTHTWTAEHFIHHSGDVMNDIVRRGNHTIVASLGVVPTNVYCFYFILAAYNSPTISHYPRPTVRLIEGANGKELDKYPIERALKWQAVVMCALHRIGGGWTVTALGRTSEGNVLNYNPLVQTCRALLGHLPK